MVRILDLEYCGRYLLKVTRFLKANRKMCCIYLEKEKLLRYSGQAILYSYRLADLL